MRNEHSADGSCELKNGKKVKKTELKMRWVKRRV